MNLLFLMAGSSEKFLDSGSQYPKNLVEINGSPMLERVIDCFAADLHPPSKLFFLINGDEDRRFHTGSVINLLKPEAISIKVPSNTAGAVCTALLAIDHIDNDEPLLIINGDIICEYDIHSIMEDFTSRKLDGGVVVFEGVHPRWSYVRCNSDGFVIEAAEKKPISKWATVGMYYYAKGRYFVEAAMDMIRKNAHFEGKFYVCPAYNEMILKQRQIGIYQIPRSSYFSLATPQGVAIYEAHLGTGE